MRAVSWTGIALFRLAGAQAPDVSLLNASDRSAERVPDHGNGDYAADRPARVGIVNAPAVVVGLIAVLAIVHALRMVGGEEWELWTVYVFALIPARLGAPQSIPMIEGSQWWSFLTYAFLHADWVHLGLNSLWLLIFGTPVARWFGSARFLLISALSAIGGGVAMVLTDWRSLVPVIGASGAVSGLIAAAIPIMYGRGRPLLPGELIRDRRALIFIVMWLGITLLSGVQGYIDEESLRIAWQAHLGGFIAGFVVYAVLMHGWMRR
jgi:membrane associated rhomboid family serine protease